MLCRSLVATALVGATSCAGVGGRGVSSAVAELPITRVVLYQNGVGYFERRGRVDGDVLHLRVRPSQINDLLKSLTVVDASEGRAVSISLPLEKSGDRILSELPAQVRNAGGLLDVLRVFRGARIVIHGDQGDAQGRVVGVEPTQVSPREGSSVDLSDWRVTLRTDEGSLRVYPMRDIEEVMLEDRTLAVGLDKSLDVSLNEGDWKPIDLAIRLVGRERHEILASYIAEMPLWKPAYRVVLDDAQPLLQGWAIVDNVSGEDWNDVKLSLVAGTPMSFIYDLHTPEFTTRVDLTPRGRRAAPAPVIEAPGVARGRPTSKDQLQRAYAPNRAAEQAGEKYDESDLENADDSAAKAEVMSLEEQAPAQAEGTSVGALFRYDLKDPVRIPDRSSTLVAIVNNRVPGGEVALFRPELTNQQGTHPYRAVLFKNQTGLTLEKGPVTIYSQGTFVGEGFLERMEKDTSAFLTYSIDGNVTMRSERSTAEEGIKLLKIVNGLIESQVLEIERTSYEVENRHPTALVAYVKTVDRGGGWKLRNQPGGSIETNDAVFVPVDVAPGQKSKLVVEWVAPVVRQVGIGTDLSKSLLEMYLGSGKVPAEVARTLSEVLKIKARLVEVGRESQRVSEQHQKLSEDQARVRTNLDVLRKTKGNEELQRSLVRKLGELEDALSKLSGRLVALSEESASLDGKMSALIAEVSLVAEAPISAQ
ncbi:MAG: hypothetical protein HYV07_03880 [Deltaproteobacteria bacterium]|nr:hypothetical protein [Deltaproteobacteria bacterium]